MQVSDEMVEAACDAYYGKPMWEDGAWSNRPGVKKDMRAALSAALAAMPQPVAEAIVADLFEDLRDRSFLKWLFSEFPTVIGNLEGEALTSLDDDVQDEIKDTWKAIIKARFAASPLGGDK